MKYKNLYISTLFLFILTCTNAQDIKLIQKSHNHFHEEYYALKNDTAIKQGKYLKRYKDYTIEQGAYKNGEKYGKWVYFSLKGFFEFEYNHSLNKVIKIANRQTPKEYLETPVFFNGSPIIPYLYMVQNVRYLPQAKKNNITGKITLGIRINNMGEITSLYIAKKLHHLLDKEVLRTAKSFPKHWKWIPATYNGHNVASEYRIDIEFELIE